MSKSITFDDNDLSAAAAASAGICDAEISFLEKLKDGDGEAFDRLVLRFSGDVYALLYRLTGDADEAGDLTQETFMAALKAIKKFRGESELKTWLFRIAVNQSRNRFRWWKRRRREAMQSLNDDLPNTDLQISDTLADASPDPEEVAIEGERARALKRALALLPRDFREVVVLFDIEGLKYDQIAASLGLNLGTVKSRLARGRIELRRLVGDI